MQIEVKELPILAALENNRLTDHILKILEDSGYDQEGIDVIKPSFKFFMDRQLQISCISTEVHNRLLNTSIFISSKSQLKNSPEMTDLLLLPETLSPDFTNVPAYVEVDANDYPINGIYYSWLNMNNHGPSVVSSMV